MAELQERISSEEFTMWVVYSTIEPFGFPVENFRSGVIASTVANVAPRKKGSKALAPDAFYPVTRTPSPQESGRMRRQLAAFHEKRRQMKLKKGNARD